MHQISENKYETTKSTQKYTKKKQIQRLHKTFKILHELNPTIPEMSSQNQRKPFKTHFDFQIYPNPQNETIKLPN